jgi:hypothetical protein
MSIKKITGSGGVFIKSKIAKRLQHGTKKLLESALITAAILIFHSLMRKVNLRLGIMCCHF